MAKKLEYKRINFIDKTDQFTLFVVEFTDKDGISYIWAPKWKDLNEVFSYSWFTESMNDGENWEEIAKTALAVISNILSNFIGQPLSRDREVDLTKRIAVKILEWH